MCGAEKDKVRQVHKANKNVRCLNSVAIHSLIYQRNYLNLSCVLNQCHQ